MVIIDGLYRNSSLPYPTVLADPYVILFSHTTHVADRQTTCRQ